MGGVEDILKGIIMRLARPKLSWLTEEAKAGRDSSEDGIEFRKIMYILEDRQKVEEDSREDTRGKDKVEDSQDKDMHHHRPTEQERHRERTAVAANSANSEEEEQSVGDKPSLEHSASLQDLSPATHFRQATTESSSSKLPSYDSSFNQYPPSDPTGRTICHLDKLAHSRSNDRIFLKNIVKKAKPHTQSSEPSQSGTISRNASDLDLVEKAETLETVEDEGESKRAVLNQIVGMLNRKYHKNIQLDPPRKN